MLELFELRELLELLDDELLLVEDASSSFDDDEELSSLDTDERVDEPDDEGTVAGFVEERAADAVELFADPGCVIAAT